MRRSQLLNFICSNALSLVYISVDELGLNRACCASRCSAGGGGGGVISGRAEFGFDVLINNFDLIDTTINAVVASGAVAGLNIWDFVTFTSLNASHTYAVHVDGFLNPPGTGSGSYSGNFHITPVPETETYAMLLAGLGLIGFSARRRMNLISSVGNLG